MSDTALILIAHGSRDPEWAAPLRRVCALVSERAPGLRIELAFLEFNTPDLEQSADTLIGEGFAHLVVLPMFIAQGGHLKEDVPRIIGTIRQRHSGVGIELASALGDSDDILQAMANHVLALAGK